MENSEILLRMFKEGCDAAWLGWEHWNLADNSYWLFLYDAAIPQPVGTLWDDS